VQALFVSLLYLLFVIIRRKHELYLRLPLFAFALGCTLPISFAAARCTALSGKVCLVANDAAQNMLMGLVPDLGVAEFSYKGLYLRYENPSQTWRGAGGTMTFDFPPWDQARLLEVIGKHVRDEPLKVLGRCFIHLYDLYGGSPLWPIADPDITPYSRAGNVAFAGFVLLPLFSWLVFFRRSKPLPLRDPWMLLLPIAAISVTIFFTLGESRYRIPFDGYTLILGAYAWTAIFGRPAAQASAGAETSEEASR
jgi:hypothetical protein